MDVRLFRGRESGGVETKDLQPGRDRLFDADHGDHDEVRRDERDRGRSGRADAAIGTLSLLGL